jgi:hypothetical protein
MLGYEKFIGMFLRFNILLDNFKEKRSGFLGRLNIHETDTERKCFSLFGSRTEMARQSLSLSSRFNTFSDVRARMQQRYQKDQFDMSLVFQHCSIGLPLYGKAFLPRICSVLLCPARVGNAIQNKSTNSVFLVV